MSCYEKFGWTPDDCKRILSRYPSEASLLSVFFEELSAWQGEEVAKHQNRTQDEPGWHTDLVLDDDEDED